LTALGLLVVACLFRLNDIFVLRLDERWGEIVVSKALGVVVLLVFVFVAGSGPRSAGLHSRSVVPSLLLGAGLTGVALLLGYATEFIAAVRRGARPAIELAAIDPKTGLMGAAGFALFLFVGNIVNSFAEEGLFRGVFLPLSRRKLAPWIALVFSALLFGIWHLPWAIKAVINQGGAAQADISAALVGNFVPQVLMGVVWGYLYLRTGNLWGSWTSHTLTNSALNFIHVRTAASLDAGLSLRMSIFTVLMLLGMLVIWRVSRWRDLPQVQPWAL
ncbi:MAG TPA: CPBP family intramembrane glutamic endopeptidase, partial [Spirochaetia bacterium]